MARAASTPARCTRRSSAPRPGAARFAAWRSSPDRFARRPEDNPELGDDDAASGWVVLTAAAARSPWRLRSRPPAGAAGLGAVWTWFELALATPVVLWGGWPFFVRAWQSIVNRSLNMFTLIGLGAGVAYAYSVVARCFPMLFPRRSAACGGEVAVYFEAAAVIVTLVLLGQVLELRARSRTRAPLRRCWGLHRRHALGSARRWQRRRTCRSSRSRLATDSECGLARRFR